MPIRVSCNSCGGVLHAPDDSAGKRGRCPTCGTILAIPADGSRVADAPPPPGLGIPAPQPATYGVAPPDPPAFPRPPAFGAPEAAKSSFNAMGRSTTAAPGATSSRVPPAPGRADARPAAPTEEGAKRWLRVRRGLGQVRLGFILIMLGALLPALLTILEANGVPLPNKDPGVLDAKGVPLASEIKVGVAVALFLVGGLVLTLGRLNVVAVPRATNSRSLASAAAFATVLSFLGYSVAVGLGVLATINGAAPKLIPYQDALDMQVNLQTRLDRYLQHNFVIASETTGAIQRLAAAVFLVFAVLAELWALGVLGRIAVHLRHDRAAAKVARAGILFGLLAAAWILGALAYDFGGAEIMRQDVVPKWDALAPGVKSSLRAGLIALAVLVPFWLLSRATAAVRRAIGDSIPA